MACGLGVVVPCCYHWPDVDSCTSASGRVEMSFQTSTSHAGASYLGEHVPRHHVLYSSAGPRSYPSGRRASKRLMPAVMASRGPNGAWNGSSRGGGSPRPMLPPDLAAALGADPNTPAQRSSPPPPPTPTSSSSSGGSSKSKQSGNQRGASGPPANAAGAGPEVWQQAYAPRRDESGDAAGTSMLHSASVKAAAAARAAAEATVRAALDDGTGRLSTVNEAALSAVARDTASAIAGPPKSAALVPNSGRRHNLPEVIMGDPIWAAIRAEARLEAEQEPLLSSFLYASILGHPCFERSLGFTLANRLASPAFLATQLLDIFDDVLLNDFTTKVCIRMDLQAVKDRDPSCMSYSQALLYFKGYHALQAYRIAHVLWNRGQRVLAFALQSRMSEVFAVDIHPAAKVGQGILLDHATGVVIGETAVVGDRVSILQGVTLGGTGKMAGDRHPKIEADVLIGAGATILGNIVVGRGSLITPGSLVLKEIPPHSMVAGSPAQVVGQVKEPQPSLTMKHDLASGFCAVWEQAVLDSTTRQAVLDETTCQAVLEEKARYLSQGEGI